MKRFIRKVAVLGSGVMGSRIACHYANIGCEVVLLDIPPNELNDAEKKKGASLEDKAVRNRIVNSSLQFALKSNPSPIYLKSFATRIETGNFDDKLQKIKEIPFDQTFTFKDNDGFIYSFDIYSIFNLIMKTNHTLNLTNVKKYDQIKVLNKNLLILIKLK